MMFLASKKYKHVNSSSLALLHLFWIWLCHRHHHIFWTHQRPWLYNLQWEHFNSTNQYVGIWYNSIYVSTIVCGSITISEDGVLEVLDGEKEVIWSANVTNSVPNSSAQLLDSGNLFWQENTTGTSIWESFQYPSDTFLRTMKLSTNVRIGKKVQLTSWKSPSDPSIGIFSFGIQPLSLPQVFIQKDGCPYWRSGPWNGWIFIGISNMYSVYCKGLSFVDDHEGNIYLTYDFADEPLLLCYPLNSQGNLEENIGFIRRRIGWWGGLLWRLSVMFMASVGHLEAMIHRFHQFVAASGVWAKEYRRME